MAKQVSFNGYLLRQFGAYIRTDLSALVQVNGVASGIIGIMGLAEKGPVNTATTITSYTQLVNTFGDGPLVRHGLSAYIGGANTLVAVRLDDTDAPDAATGSSFTVTVNSTDSYTFTSRELGTYGDNIAVRVSAPSIYGTFVGSDNTLRSTDAFYETSGIFIPSDIAFDDTATDGAYYVVQNWDSSTGHDTGDYEIFQWNGERWNVADVSAIKSVITVRIGASEESIEVPYYINESGWVRALASTTPTDYYYVLRNTITNQIREIPETWLAGEGASLDQDDFERIVNELKADEEEIFNGSTGKETYFQVSGNTPTEFPFELVEHIVNYGGFGSGPSSLILLSEVQDEANLNPNPTLVSQGFTNLIGGFNSVDGTGWTSTLAGPDGDPSYVTTSPGAPSSAWEKALAVLENEEVNFVQPAYIFAQNATFTSKYNFFKSLAAKIVAHVNLMSNTPNRKFRSSVLGLPSGRNGSTSLTAAEFLTQTQTISGTINSDRIQLWAGGFRSTALETVSTERLYGAEWLASFAAGAHAAREVSVSLTFAQMAGIFTGGLEYPWTTSQKDDLYGRSLAFVLKRRTSTGATEYVAAHNYTSFTGAPSRGIQLFITRRIVDYMNTFIYKNLEENFIGRKSRGAETAARIRAFVESLLRRLISEDTLVAYEGLVVTADPDDKTVYNVEFSFQPVTEIDFILTTNKLVYNLA